jgi:hypothetical protein
MANTLARKKTKKIMLLANSLKRVKINAPKKLYAKSFATFALFFNIFA